MINSLCYQIQAEIALCGTPFVNISFLHSYNHLFSYKTTPSYKDNPGRNLLKHSRETYHKLVRFMNTSIASVLFPQCWFHAFSWS